MDANELLLGGGGGKYFPFLTKGTMIDGEVAAEPQAGHQTDVKDGSVKTFDDGTPRPQVTITLQTELRDPADPEDEGLRTIYAKGEMLKAIGQAMRTAGVKKLEIGGRLQVAYTDERPPKTKGFNPTKLFVARYTPPAANALADAFFGTQPAGGQAAANVVANTFQGAQPMSTLESMRAMASGQQPPF